MFWKAILNEAGIWVHWNPSDQCFSMIVVDFINTDIIKILEKVKNEINFLVPIPKDHHF